MSQECSMHFQHIFWMYAPIPYYFVLCTLYFVLFCTFCDFFHHRVSITPLEGAQTSIYCAVDESLETSSGKYYEHLTEHAPNKMALDSDLCRRTYDATLKALQEYVNWTIMVIQCNESFSLDYIKCAFLWVLTFLVTKISTNILFNSKVSHQCIYIVACHLPRGSIVRWREDMSGGAKGARRNG